MSVSRWERLAPLTGAAFVVLYFVGFGLIGEVGRTSTPTSVQIVDLLTDGSRPRLVGVYLSLVSVTFLLWFVGSVRVTLRGAEGALGRLSAVAFGGGVAAGAALLIGFASIGAATMRADSTQGIGPEAAIVFYDLYRSLLSVSAIGFGVLIGAAAVVAFRTGAFPPWLTWSSAFVAIGLVSPVLFFFVFIALIWVLVVSIWLFIQKPTGVDTENATEAPT